MKDCGARVLAERVKYGAVCQLARVVCTKPPADNLPCFETHDDSKVAKGVVMLNVSEVLHPGLGVNHPAVIHAALRSANIPEDSVVMQDIGWRVDLGHIAARVFVCLACGRHRHAGDCPYPACFLLAPAKMDRKSADTVKRMLCVRGS